MTWSQPYEDILIETMETLKQVISREDRSLIFNTAANNIRVHAMGKGLTAPQQLITVTAQPISDTFGLTSNPTGSSVCFSSSLMDSRMFLLSFFT